MGQMAVAMLTQRTVSEAGGLAIPMTSTMLYIFTENARSTMWTQNFLC